MEKRSKLISTIILFFFICSFSRGQELVLGCYKYQSSIGKKVTLNILEDTTFVYTTIVGMVNDTISGKWHINEKKVILIPQKEESYHTLQPCIFCENQLTIKVYSNTKKKEELKFSGVDIYKQGNIIKSGLIDSITFSNIDFDSIKVNFLGYQSYFLMPNVENKFMHKVYLAPISYSSDEIILSIKRKGLVTRNGTILKKQKDKSTKCFFDKK